MAHRNEYKDQYREGARFGRFALSRGALWALAFGTVALIIGIILSSMAIFGWGFLQKSTADFRGSVEEREITRADGDFRVFTYEHFFDQYGTIRATARRIVDAEAELAQFEDTHDLSELTRSESEQYTFFQTNARSTRNIFYQQVENYNADAAKETRNAFLDSDLPDRVDGDMVLNQARNGTLN